MFSKNEVTNALRKVQETLDSFISNVKGFIDEQRKFNDEQRKFNDEQRKFMKAVLDKLNVHDQKLDYLVAELSRYTGNNGSMLLSIFAFCKLYDVKFSYQSLAEMGLLATRVSRRQGKAIEPCADPRFGTVNLYEPEVLENLFLFADEQGEQ